MWHKSHCKSYIDQFHRFQILITEGLDEILSQKISTILSDRRVNESTLDFLSWLLVKESVQMGFSIIFWSQDPYNWYVVLGPNSKILLENSQNWELLSC